MMVLLGDSRIGEGSGGCERFWSINAMRDGLRLAISGDDCVTCHLCQGNDGVFRGRWIRHERPLVELAPLASASARKPVAAVGALQRGEQCAETASADEVWRRIAGEYMCRYRQRKSERLTLTSAGRVEREGQVSLLWWLDLNATPPHIVLSDFSKNAYALTWQADGVFRAQEATAADAPVELARIHPLGPAPGVSRNSCRGERFYVGIPTVSRYDLLNQCLDAILDGDATSQTVCPRMSHAG